MRGRGALLAAALLLWPAGQVGAQVSGGEADTLDTVEAALDSGRVDRARSLLDAWTSPRDVASGDEANRVRFLRARLTTDADSAEDLYLSLALEGDARYGARAWLRLGQLHLATGEAARARSELERLRADYPSSDLARESWYWTGLAAAGEGDGAAACGAWRRAASAAGRTAELAAGELERCRGGTLAGADPTEAARAGPGSEEAPEDTTAAAEPGEEAAPEGGAAAAEAGGFAVQLGAFSRREGARALAERAREAGFEVRTVGPSRGDGLIRVRTRPVADRREAAELVRRLKAEGLPAMVVNLDES